jgi:glycerol-1-phosphate dehydrogenase [NAD(P)+]
VKRIYPLPRIEFCSLSQIQETQPIAVITSEQAWAALEGRLDHLPIVWRGNADEASEPAFHQLASAMPAAVKSVYGVGGGVAVDAAKTVAHIRGLPLIAVPTALSVDAHLTPASGVRKGGCVVYIETGPPNIVYIDWEILAAAPQYLRAAGIADVLSIATALWDWRMAEQAGHNPPDACYVPYAAAIAETLLAEAIAIAPSAGRGEIAGLRRLLELLALEVQLCNLLGHARPEEGSEHIFAYALEHHVGHGLPHIDFVGPGIIAMAAAQGQAIERLRDALVAVGARLNHVDTEIVRQTLFDLPTYATQHRLPYGIAHVLDEQRIEAALQSLR